MKKEKRNGTHEALLCVWLGKETLRPVGMETGKEGKLEAITGLNTHMNSQERRQTPYQEGCCRGLTGAY